MKLQISAEPSRFTNIASAEHPLHVDLAQVVVVNQCIPSMPGSSDAMLVFSGGAEQFVSGEVAENALKELGIENRKNQSPDV
jgi:hypothetical protein